MGTVGNCAEKGDRIMTEDFEVYEKECEALREENEVYLEIFQRSLAAAGLSDKTIKKHCENIDFYLNVFLHRYEPCPMPDGCNMVGSFLGDFFIRKCMWSTPTSIKSYAASLKKFYKCMLVEGKIDAEDYEDLVYIIKMDMEDWMDECEDFNSPERYW
jgi:hypothetical protein